MAIEHEVKLYSVMLTCTVELDMANDAEMIQLEGSEDGAAVQKVRLYLGTGLFRHDVNCLSQVAVVLRVGPPNDE